MLHLRCVLAQCLIINQHRTKFGVKKQKKWQFLLDYQQ